MPEEKWFVTTKKADFNHIAAEFGISPVLARIIRNRDIVTEEEVRYFLHGTLEDLHDPYLLKGMREGSAFLYAAIREKSRSASLEIMMWMGFVLLMFYIVHCSF